MPLIRWNESSMSVNVREIDLQHQHLVELMNELHDAMLQQKTRTILGKIIEGLLEYAESHFATEEKYFDAFSYPEAAYHKAVHQEFVKQASDFQTEFSKGRLLFSLDVMQFLEEWLLTHIEGEDRKYGPFFNEHGLS